jgi:ribosome modulation factor
MGFDGHEKPMHPQAVYGFRQVIFENKFNYKDYSCETTSLGWVPMRILSFNASSDPDAWEAGYTAGRAGVSRVPPYPSSSPCAGAWLEGWGRGDAKRRSEAARSVPSSSASSQRKTYPSGNAGGDHRQRQPSP